MYIVEVKNENTLYTIKYFVYETLKQAVGKFCGLCKNEKEIVVLRDILWHNYATFHNGEMEGPMVQWLDRNDPEYVYNFMCEEINDRLGNE